MGLPTTAVLPRGVAMLLLLAVVLLPGCSPKDSTVVLLQSPVEVVAVPVLSGAAGLHEISIRRPAASIKIRTTVSDLSTSDRTASHGKPPTAEEVLRSRVRWEAPYLFVREDNGGGNAARSDVDHVFKLVAPDRIEWIGTLSARFGAPGAQWKEGRFLDLYDRLEFTPLTSHAFAPVFTQVMEEKDLKFVVDLDRTWQIGRTNFEAAFAKLGQHATNATAARRPLDEAQKREIRGLTLQCLAFTRYCRKIAEYDASLDRARQILGEIGEMQEAVGAIRPGELSPSLEEILRLRPALRNVFKETETGEAAEPTIAVPTAPGLKP